MDNLNKNFFVIALGIILIFVSAFLFLHRQALTIVTDKKKYSFGETLKIQLKNYSLNKELCFSTCYPYSIERKFDSWKRYTYKDCVFSDKVEVCLRPWSKRAFAISLPQILESGVYKISVPTCKNCKIGQDFQENQRFYSNEFEIQ